MLVNGSRGVVSRVQRTALLIKEREEQIDRSKLQGARKLKATEALDALRACEQAQRGADARGLRSVRGIRIFKFEDSDLQI
jgi:hypothetical protein